MIFAQEGIAVPTVPWPHAPPERCDATALSDRMAQAIRAAHRGPKSIGIHMIFQKRVQTP